MNYANYDFKLKDKVVWVTHKKWRSTGTVVAVIDETYIRVELDTKYFMKSRISVRKDKVVEVTPATA